MDIDYSTIFSSGDIPTLIQVLDQREKRVSFLEYLAKKHTGNTLVCFKLNIPGPIKNNSKIEQLFTIEQNKFLNKFDNDSIIFMQEISLPTGPEGFLVLSIDPFAVKKLSVLCEETRTGRLSDIDVYSTDNSVPDPITRSLLTIPPRKCFLCSNDAKICSSRRLHSVKQLQQFVVTLLGNYNNL